MSYSTNLKSNSKKDKTAEAVIIVLSVVVPLLVSLMLLFPQSGKFTDLDVTVLPGLNAILNSATFIMLCVGFIGIKKNKNERLHKAAMYSAFILSSCFLISYVIYHANAPHTSFGGQGVVAIVYFSLLISHILLSAVIVPLVLFSIYFAISRKLDKHKKLVKFTWPIWMYVASSGVVVYFMIKPYYS